MTVRVYFDIDDKLYRALLPDALARGITMPMLFRELGENYAHALALDGIAPVGSRPKPIPRPSRRWPKPGPVKSAQPRRRKRLTAAEQEKIATMHTAGETAASIAEAVGISLNTVGRYIDKLGLERHGHKNRKRAAA